MLIIFLFSHSQEIEIYPVYYSSDSVKKTYFNRDEDICWPPQCHNFDSTEGAGGFTAGAAAPAVNMLGEALTKGFWTKGALSPAEGAQSLAKRTPVDQSPSEVILY